MNDATRAVRAGLPPPRQGAPFRDGPVFASVYHFSGELGSAPFTYGRNHNPTWTAYEAALGELEGAHAIVYGSGMAAVAAVYGAVLPPGSRLVIGADAYYLGRTLAQELAAAGVTVDVVAPGALAARERFDGVTLVWIETPSNPTLEIVDIAAVAARAHAAGALVAVDNTTATILGQRPLDLGADLSVASDSKSLTGHSDLILGHVATRDPALHEALLRRRSVQGAVPGPMEVWLAHRSLATLALRLERQSDNALALAEHLRDHPAVVGVRYPGLAGDPSHAVAVRQMLRFGPLVALRLRDGDAVRRFFDASRLIAEATSFGGVHTSGEQRARWKADAVGREFIRLSVGCEDAGDLIADLDAALAE